jgi:hypothetical protein
LEDAVGSLGKGQHAEARKNGNGLPGSERFLDFGPSALRSE